MGKLRAHKSFNNDYKAPASSSENEKEFKFWVDKEMNNVNGKTSLQGTQIGFTEVLVSPENDRK